jgi:hypothetical protein
MRKALATLAVTATAFVAPMLAGGTAYAAETSASVAPVEVSVADLTALLGGCTTTYANAVLGTKIGPVVSLPPGGVLIQYSSATAYAGAQTGNTVTYVVCVV